MTVMVGAIADDFTGALDLANNFVRAGLRVAHVNGVTPSLPAPEDVDAVVVALKSRTAPVDEATRDSLEAIRWLRGLGATKFYVKYCSTFDSTPTGNIGPVIDAVMEELNVLRTVAVPSFPDNGRTVYRGHLFVYDQLLSESSMRHHPLTPMTDSDVVRLLSPQTSAEVRLISHDHVSAGAEALRAGLDEVASNRVVHVVDAITNDDLLIIAAAVADDVLVSGGSGLAMGLPSAWGLVHRAAGDLPAASGKRAIVAGSVSARTNEQVERFTGPKLRINPLETLDDQIVNHAVEWALGHASDGSTPLIYSTATPDEVAAAQAAQGAAEVGAALETALSAITARLVEQGVRQLVVAGGETSGACVQQLGIQELRVGRQIDPGVPWAYGPTSTGVAVHIALKSGNFGSPDFFNRAFEELA